MTESFYDDREAMSPAERAAYYNERVRWVVDYAYKNAPAWRNKLDQAGINPSQIATIEDLKEVPITSVPELLKAQELDPPFGGFLAIPPNSLKRIFMAMGPEIVPMGFSGVLYEVAAKSLYTSGVRKGDILLNTMPYHPTYAGMVVDEGAGRIGATIIPAGPGNIELKIEAIKRLKPVRFLGTSSFFMALVKTAEQLGYDFYKDFSIRSACFGAEKLATSLRKTVEDDYNIDVTDVYAVGGVGTVAYECSQKKGMHIPEELFIEFIDPDSRKRVGPGEPGEVVITVLDENFPLIRFGTGDLAAYTDEPCPCGRTSNRITAILGRTGESFKVRGLFLHPTQLEQAISSIPDVSRFQAVAIRQNHKDILNINIELASAEVDKEAVMKTVGERVHDICRLRVDNVNIVSPGTIPEDCKRIVDERVW